MHRCQQNNCRLQTVRCWQRGLALMSRPTRWLIRGTVKEGSQHLVSFGFGAKYTHKFRPKPKLITVSSTIIETRPKVALLSDSVPKPKLEFGRPLIVAYTQGLWGQGQGQSQSFLKQRSQFFVFELSSSLRTVFWDPIPAKLLKSIFCHYSALFLLITVEQQDYLPLLHVTCLLHKPNLH